MFSTESIQAMPKVARASFLQSSVTAIQTQIAALPEGGARNDAVLELNRCTQLLIAANARNVR